MKNVTANQNILKLRELSEKLTKNDADDYKGIVIQLKTIIDDGKEMIEETESSRSKIKCYESMCSSITNLLNNVNFV